MWHSPNVHLSEEDIVVVLMLVSREIIEHRGSPYQGVRDYVDALRKVRRKLKRVHDGDGKMLHSTTHP